MRRLGFAAMVALILSGGGIALARNSAGGGAQGVPVPSATASPTQTATPIFTFTATTTPEGTATETPPPTATQTPEDTATQTPVDTATPLATATFTAVATFTATSEPEGTATETPTVTATNEAEATTTSTPIFTATATSTPEGTATETPVPTATEVAATATFTPISTATATSSPEGTATETPEATATPIFTATSTGTPEATASASATATPTPTRTGTPDGDERRFIARLLGENVVPPVDTEARGRAVFKLNKNNVQLRYDVFGRDIDGVTTVDIHCGDPGVNGPVVGVLFGPDPNGVEPSKRILAHGTLTPEDVIPVPDSAACPGGIANFDELIAKVRAGQIYLDVHTLDHPEGEIRGQIGIFEIPD